VKKLRTPACETSAPARHDGCSRGSSSTGADRLGRRTLVGPLALLASLALAAAALASSSLTVKGAGNSKLGETVLVNPAGRTLYALEGESTHHLLCKSGACTAIWPPLTVRSRTTRLRAGAGVHGALGLIRRPNGALQVTLRGKPLYRYSGDSAAGQANGEGIRSFGGTWHAVPAAPAPAATPPATNPQPPSEPSPPYSYPLHA
jgi:predicted lipoprotein with Yx(FWY)xxD motif